MHALSPTKEQRDFSRGLLTEHRRLVSGVFRLFFATLLRLTAAAISFKLARKAKPKEVYRLLTALSRKTSLRTGRMDHQDNQHRQIKVFNKTNSLSGKSPFSYKSPLSCKTSLIQNKQANQGKQVRQNRQTK